MAIYACYNPLQDGVTYVAISFDTTPPHVWGVYRTTKQSTLPQLINNFEILPIAEAREKYTFQHAQSSGIVMKKCPSGRPIYFGKLQLPKKGHGQ